MYHYVCEFRGKLIGAVSTAQLPDERVKCALAMLLPGVVESEVEVLSGGEGDLPPHRFWKALTLF